MNAKTKRRLVVVTGIIVMVMVVVLAFVASSSTAKTVSVDEAASGQVSNQRIQVTGNVLKDSYAIEGNTLAFTIYDPDNAEASTLPVTYDGAAASTFGNDVTAICTGKVGDDGVLRATELVTKCPSKYESGTSALTVSRLVGYDQGIVDKTVRVTGSVVAGSPNAAGQGDRFVLADTDDPSQTISVIYDGAASDAMLADGSQVVLTGNVGSDGKFSATDIALQS